VRDFGSPSDVVVVEDVPQLTDGKAGTARDLVFVSLRVHNCVEMRIAVWVSGQLLLRPGFVIEPHRGRTALHSPMCLAVVCQSDVTAPLPPFRPTAAFTDAAVVMQPNAHSHSGGLPAPDPAIGGNDGSSRGSSSPAPWLLLIGDASGLQTAAGLYQNNRRIVLWNPIRPNSLSTVAAIDAAGAMAIGPHGRVYSVHPSMEGIAVFDLLTGASIPAPVNLSGEGLRKPSGIVIVNDTLIVSDLSGSVFVHRLI
jgi:hypothetical protein